MGNIIDLIGKHLSRIKTLSILILIILLAFSSIKSGCDRDEMGKLVERITGLNIANDILRKSNAELDKMLADETALRKRLEAELKEANKNKDKLLLEKKKLQDELQAIPHYVISIPADSSYQFLDKTAYPFAGDKNFPFSEPQVKGIHVTYLENDVKNNIISNYEFSLMNCENRVSLLDSINHSLYSSQKVYARKLGDMQTITDNVEEKSDLLKKQLQRQERNNKLFKIGTAIGAVALILLLI